MIEGMPLRSVAVLALSAACTAASLAGPQDPPAQSMGDLRQEIERLRQDIARRDAELAAAKARIESLERQVAEAQASKAAPGNGPAAAPQGINPEPAPFPADPTLGPGGLLAAMQSAYLADFPTMPDTASPAKLNMHLRSLEGWCAKVNRDNVRQYSWRGTIDAASFAVSGRSCSFTAVFRNGTREFRYPFTVDQSMLARVRGRHDAPTTDEVQFGVLVKPRLAANPQRPTPQAFEQPPMVAPYLDFALDVELRNVQPLPPAPAPAP